MSDTTKRYDILILPSSGSYRAPQGAVRSIVHTLAFRGFANPIDEAIHKDWLEIYMEPGPAAHEVFEPHVYTGPQPVFKEAVLRTAEEPFFPEFGPTATAVHLALEFRGCVYQAPLGPFRKLFLESLQLRVNSYNRPHVELPSHKTVSDEDVPDDPKKKKKERGPGLAGTQVEEW